MQIRSISGIVDPSKARLVYYTGSELVHAPADNVGYQPSASFLTALAALELSGNSLEVIRVKDDESGLELAPLSTPGLLFGATLSNNVTDANNDIDIASGMASEITTGIVKSLPTGITKRLDAAWAAGTGNGGLDAGSKANSTWYHVWLIGLPSTSLWEDGLFSTSATAPTMPSGYTRKRRLGAVVTDGSGNIRAFRQVQNWFHFATPIQDNPAFSAGTSAANMTISVPLGVKVMAEIVFVASSASNSFVSICDPDLGSAALNHFVLFNNAAATGSTAIVQCWTDTTQHLSVRSTVASTTVNQYTRGWMDHRDTTV